VLISGRQRPARFVAERGSPRSSALRSKVVWYGINFSFSMACTSRHKLSSKPSGKRISQSRNRKSNNTSYLLMRDAVSG
jgi:hypothetical protein